MQVPARRTGELGELPAPAGVDSAVDLIGDAWVAITAPFYPDDNPLARQRSCTLAGERDLAGAGALVPADLPLRSILHGTLTYHHPSVDLLTGFVGGDRWLAELRSELSALASDQPDWSGYDRIELSGMLFPDGYGSVGVALRLPGGWTPERRAATLHAIGVTGREVLAARLRTALLPLLEQVLHRTGADRDTTVALPYFNLTYAGSTDHAEPGRLPLHDRLRTLVYPEAATPLASSSPWLDEYFYAGYAYHLLAMRDPVPNLRRLILLLLILNVSYARLARFAAAADRALVSRDYRTDLAWLADTERRLRSEYQSLITPTFSFDHHALKVRDAILRSWDVPKLQSRTDNLISMVRHAVEFRMAQDQARRIRRLNLIVVVLTTLSVIPTVEAVLALYRLLTG